MKDEFQVSVTVGDVTIRVRRPMLATEPFDNEENMARLTDQVVRAAFREYNQKQLALSAAAKGTA